MRSPRVIAAEMRRRGLSELAAKLEAAAPRTAGVLERLEMDLHSAIQALDNIKRSAHAMQAQLGAIGGGPGLTRHLAKMVADADRLKAEIDAMWHELDRHFG